MKYTVCIWDSKSGNWELNELVHPLKNNYNTGMCSIMLNEYIKEPVIVDKNFVEAHMLRGQKWYFYIWFGFKVLFKQIKIK